MTARLRLKWPCKISPSVKQGAGVGGPLNHRLVKFAGKFESLDEEKIARDQRGLQAEFLECGFFAAPRFGAVDDVVVQQTLRCE